MSRRDYIELAADFKRLREDAAHSETNDTALAIHRKAIDRTIDVVCDALKRDNRNFDRERFLTACGR